MRDRSLKGIEAVIQWKKGVLAKRNGNRLFSNCEDGRFWLLGTGRHVGNRRPPLPLGDSLLVDAKATGQGPQALLTMLYRSTD